MIIEGNYFYEQESGNEQQKYVSAIDSFMREHNLYIPQARLAPICKVIPKWVLRHVWNVTHACVFLTASVSSAVRCSRE